MAVLPTSILHFNFLVSDFFFSWHYTPLWVCILQPSSGVIASSLTRFLDYRQRRATVGRTPLNEWSARRRDLYLTTHNTHNRQTSMPRVGFESKISAGERPKTYALDRAATGIGFLYQIYFSIPSVYIWFKFRLTFSNVQATFVVCGSHCCLAGRLLTESLTNKACVPT